MRRWLAYNILFLSLVISANLVLVPFIVAGRTVRESNEIEIQMLRRERSQGGVTMRPLGEVIADTNTLITIVGKPVSSAPTLSSLVRYVVEHGTRGISLESILLSRASGIDIRGIARDRRALLDLVAAYRNKNIFSEVDSPISNLIQEENITFTIHLESPEVGHGARN
ncbi:MAG: hypothetical protein HYS59_00105 [Candidatus Vogelbacteria bacterium]|nr:hypothetical protein [Candidatus Vogelbacteria bacterium]